MANRKILPMHISSLVLVAVISGVAEAANIVFFVGFGAPSHRLAMQPLADALASKGHNLTFITQYPVTDNNNPNMTFLHPPKLTEYFIKKQREEFNFYDVRASGYMALRIVLKQSFGVKVCEMTLADPKILAWLKSTPKIDLVVIDALFNECGFGIAYVHGAKTILFSVSTILPWQLETLGLPDESAWMPDPIFNVAAELHFGHRLLQAVVPMLWDVYRDWLYYPQLDQIIGAALNMTDLPKIKELVKRTDLTFVNTHPAQEFPRALPPNIIAVGGMSWKGTNKTKPLPEKFSKFIDEGTEGFIYISFGSLLDFFSFPEKVQQTFISALKKFPNIQFIWKLNKTPENLPKNIMVEKWLPQQDLLLHPKIRAFITHGGLGSVNEAIFSSVPLIILPMFAEQDYNTQLAAQRGMAIKVEITNLVEEDFVAAIHQMLSTDSYKKSVEKLKPKFLDRPTKPVDLAVWWTEFVLRQESTEYLRSKNVSLQWWKKRQLDVWLFIFIFVITSLLGWIYVFWKIIKRCLGNARSLPPVSPSAPAPTTAAAKKDD